MDSGVVFLTASVFLRQKTDLVKTIYIHLVRTDIYSLGSILKEDEIHGQSGFIIYLWLGALRMLNSTKSPLICSIKLLNPLKRYEINIAAEPEPAL